MHQLSNRDLIAIINGYELGDVTAAKEELARRGAIGRIQFASAGATKNREDVRKR